MGRTVAVFAVVLCVHFIILGNLGNTPRGFPGEGGCPKFMFVDLESLIGELRNGNENQVAVFQIIQNSEPENVLLVIKVES